MLKDRRSGNTTEIAHIHLILSIRSISGACQFVAHDIALPRIVKQVRSPTSKTTTTTTTLIAWRRSDRTSMAPSAKVIVLLHTESGASIRCWLAR